MTPDHTLPSSLRALNQAEHTLLLVLRVIVTGQSEHLGAVGVMREFCGQQARENLDILTVVVQRIAIVGRREIRVSPPGTLRLTRDEQLLLAIFAAAQANDFIRLSAHLSFLLGRTPDAGFIAGVACVADAFLSRGGRFRLPPVNIVPFPSEEAPAAKSAWRGRR